MKYKVIIGASCKPGAIVDVVGVIDKPKVSGVQKSILIILEVVEDTHDGTVGILRC